MKKGIISISILASMLLLSSCAWVWESRMGEKFLGGGDDKQAEQKFEQVMEAIENQDREALKELFSKKALDEADDFDENADYLFEFFQGEVQTWKREFAGSESIDDGHRMKDFKMYYTVETDKQEYLCFLFLQVIDTDDPDNVGLYTLRMIKAEDEETQFGYWPDMKLPGIYKPEE